MRHGDDEEQDQRLAADPSTPPETLRELLRQSPSLAALVARNPGAPTDLLLGFPYEWIAAHPVVVAAAAISDGLRPDGDVFVGIASSVADAEVTLTATV